MNKNIGKPNIRFDRFTSSWERKKICNLMVFSNGINAPKENYGKGRKMISVMDILSNESISYDNIKSSVEVDIKTENRNKIESGDIVFVRSSEVRDEVGWAKAYLDKEYALFSGFTIRGKKISEFDSLFLELSINGRNRYQIERKAGGSTRYNVSQSILKDLEISQPTLIEQKKISGIFEKLADIILLQQQLLNDYKQLKKAMLQKMFPQKGESVPRLRFAGFNEDWKKEKLNKYLNEFSHKSTVENQHSVLSSTTTGIEIRDGRVSGKSNLGYKIIKKGNVVLSPQNLWMGNINYNNEFKVGLVSPSYKTFSIENAEENFLLYYLKLPKMLYLYGQASVQGASVVRRNLDMDLFNQIVFLVPDRVEQKKIGELFRQLDTTIELHEKKLETYQSLKKAMLQKMFV